MIARFLGVMIALVFTFTGIGAIGALIALDFLSEDIVIGRVVADTSGARPQPVVGPPEPVAVSRLTAEEAIVAAAPVLEGAKDITFFTEVPVDGATFDVVTGTQFATPDDLAAGLVAQSWCYVMAEAPDGVMRRINLAAQKAVNGPVYEALKTLPTKELALLS